LSKGKKGAGKSTSPPAEAPWQRLRRLRQAEIDAANAHGQQLVQRYGDEYARPGFAVVGYQTVKRRPRRRR
jgi:hypothetical protein